MFPGNSTVDVLESYGLLESDILLSHATGLSDSDAEKLRNVNAALSSTPDTELQMGHGWPVCFQDNVNSISSLGVDCHSNNAGGIVAQMRIGLQAERGRRNDETRKSGKIPGKMCLAAQEAFQLATIKGARAIKMADKLGSLEEGKIADLVVLDALSPGMICAAEEDPVAAIILHSSVADVDSVIVDGQFRKRDGRLTGTRVDLTLAPGLEIHKTEMVWRDVAAELLGSRERIIEAETHSGADDREAAFEAVLGLFGKTRDSLAM
jgi:cytosine/adenosine deaminase-related metal-dependent hydrolase